MKLSAALQEEIEELIQQEEEHQRKLTTAKQISYEERTQTPEERAINKKLRWLREDLEKIEEKKRNYLKEYYSRVRIASYRTGYPDEPAMTYSYSPWNPLARAYEVRRMAEASNRIKEQIKELEGNYKPVKPSGEFKPLDPRIFRKLFGGPAYE